MVEPRAIFFLMKVMTRFDAIMDGAFNGQLVQENPLVGPFKSGTFDLGIGKKLITGRRVGKEQGRVRWTLAGLVLFGTIPY